MAERDYLAELTNDPGGDALRDWIRPSIEPALHPAEPIIDPHHHLWDRRPRLERGDAQRLHARYLADDLIEDTRGAGHNVIDTVFVECVSMYREDADAPNRAVGETEFVQGIAAMAASGLYGEDVRVCGGIVSFVDLTRGAAAGEVLEAHVAAGKNFRGIRHAHGWHASPDIRNSHHPTRDIEGLLAKSNFREGFAQLDRLGLSFDCWGYHTQLAEVADLARAFPGVTVVLNHCGGPMALGPYAGQRETVVWDAWLKGVKEVATCPNVMVKVGGCGMSTYGFGFEEADVAPGSEALAAAWLPYFAELIEYFGASRCMFESNFPVDKVSCSYANLWNAFKRVADNLGLAGAERSDLFYGTAARAYRLELAPDLAAACSG